MEAMGRVESGTGLQAEQNFSKWDYQDLLVPMGRFELPRDYSHHPLKMACLPIPPHRQF